MLLISIVQNSVIQSAEKLQNSSKTKCSAHLGISLKTLQQFKTMACLW